MGRAAAAVLDVVDHIGDQASPGDRAERGLSLPRRLLTTVQRRLAAGHRAGDDVDAASGSTARSSRSLLAQAGTGRRHHHPAEQIEHMRQGRLADREPRLRLVARTLLATAIPLGSSPICVCFGSAALTSVERPTE